MSAAFEQQLGQPAAHYELACAPPLNWAHLAAAPLPVRNNLREPGLGLRIVEAREAVEAHGDPRAQPHVDAALEGVWLFAREEHAVMPLVDVADAGWEEPAMLALRDQIQRMFGITPDNLDIQTVRDDTRDVNPHVRDPQGIVLLKGQLDSQTPIYLQYAQSRTVLGRRSITVIDGRELEQNMGNLWAAATACSWRELVTATYALRCNADLRATEEEIATLLNYQLINRSVTPNNTGLAHALLELRETRNRTQGLRVIPASVVASFGDAGANLAPPADAKHIED